MSLRFMRSNTSKNTLHLFRPHEKCGIFGLFGLGMEAARLTHAGLWALQHRGQESSGIASTEGSTLRVFKKNGLVAHVYDEEHLRLVSGHAAIGHNRYATSGGGDGSHAQPVMSSKGLLALAHNGNLPDTTKLAKFLTQHSIEHSRMNDSEMIHAALEYHLEGGMTISEAVRTTWPLLTGAFSLVLLTPTQLVAVRDGYGIRPLCLGAINGGFAVASETCALDTIGATFVREIKPGELIEISAAGLRTEQIVRGTQKLDIFEFIYFARSDSQLLGKRVDTVRKNLGRELARECTIAADVIVPVPDSAISAALGYARESGIPFDHGLIKNRYIHRTFIQPAQKLRENHVALKLNPIPEIVEGKSVALVDDSIVRGTTAKKLVERVRLAGARAVHLLIPAPQVQYPDFYGIDTPKQTDLIAFSHSEEEIAQIVGADSVHFLSYDGMIRATELPERVFSTSCFTGHYPAKIGKRSKEICTPPAASRKK
jgi:amidophosphoribosyltransferase